MSKSLQQMWHQGILDHSLDFRGTNYIQGDNSEKPVNLTRTLKYQNKVIIIIILDRYFSIKPFSSNVTTYISIDILT